MGLFLGFLSYSIDLHVCSMPVPCCCDDSSFVGLSKSGCEAGPHWFRPVSSISGPLPWGLLPDPSPLPKWQAPSEQTGQCGSPLSCASLRGPKPPEDGAMASASTLSPWCRTTIHISTLLSGLKAAWDKSWESRKEHWQWWAKRGKEVKMTDTY